MAMAPLQKTLSVPQIENPVGSSPGSVSIEDGAPDDAPPWIPTEGDKASYSGSLRRVSLNTFEELGAIPRQNRFM